MRGGSGARTVCGRLVRGGGAARVRGGVHLVSDEYGLRKFGIEEGLQTGDRGAGARTGCVGLSQVLLWPISKGSCPTQSFEEIQGPRKQISE